MSSELSVQAERHFQQHFGVSMNDLLQPITETDPAGHALKSGGVYQTLQGARRRDDPSLPQGPWQHELKRADWELVARLAVETLRSKSKDLQIAAWLLEAQIHQCGFEGVAPSIVLLEQLLRRFGDQLHPQEPDGGKLHRANVLRWINRKLLPQLKLLPMTACAPGEEFSWAAREAAWRSEQLREAEPDAGQPTLQQLQAAMARTATAHHAQLRQHLRLAIDATALLAAACDDVFEHDPPSLGAFGALLRQILDAVEAELHRRGGLAASPPAQEIGEPAPASEPAARVPVGNLAAERAHAYAQLEQAAQTLMLTDPHSPAPYLVQRALQWSRLSTAELYEEVFIRMGGQLNIFELLGLQAPASSS